MKIFFARLALVGLSLAVLQAQEEPAISRIKDDRPNIVLLVSDDGGWADFGFNNCPDFKTPSLDKLSATGTVFHQGYVAGVVCSPSRAALLVGRYQSRFGHELNLGDNPRDGLPKTEMTLADRLKALGYCTAAFGKWHLGTGPGFTPPERGFEYTYTFLAGGRSYQPENRVKDNAQTMRRNGKPVLMKEYLTDAIGKDASEYIRKSSGKSPFFLYVAFNCPHSPMQAKAGYEGRFSQIRDGQRRTLAAMQTSLDEAVGNIVQALKDRDVYGNTLIWFINDNGGATYWNYNNGGLRNRKGSLFEGGSRVAFFASWPGKFAAGVRYDKPVISLDIVATSLAAAGLKKLPAELDGVNLIPYLAGTEAVSGKPHENLYWRRDNVGAVRAGDWKMILVEGKPAHLFNLALDPFEKKDVLDSRPEKEAELLADYEEWNKGNVPPLWKEEQYWNDLAAAQHASNAPWDFRKVKVDKEKTGKKHPGKQGDVSGE